MKIKQVAIIDEHPLIIKGVREILQYEYPDMCSIGFKNPVDFLISLKKESFDFIILDLKFKNNHINGFYIIKELKQRGIRAPVIIYSAYDDDRYIKKAIRLGASAYICKNEVAEELIEAIKTIKLNSTYITKKLSNGIYVNSSLASLNIFSKREREVLLLFRKGYKNIDIAKKLNITPNTVTTYKSRIKDKLYNIEF